MAQHLDIAFVPATGITLDAWTELLASGGRLHGIFQRGKLVFVASFPSMWAKVLAQKGSDSAPQLTFHEIVTISEDHLQKYEVKVGALIGQLLTSNVESAKATLEEVLKPLDVLSTRLNTMLNHVEMPFCCWMMRSLMGWLITFQDLKQDAEHLVRQTVKRKKAILGLLEDGLQQKKLSRSLCSSLLASSPSLSRVDWDPSHAQHLLDLIKTYQPPATDGIVMEQLDNDEDPWQFIPCYPNTPPPGMTPLEWTHILRAASSASLQPGWTLVRGSEVIRFFSPEPEREEWTMPSPPYLLSPEQLASITEKLAENLKEELKERETSVLEDILKGTDVEQSIRMWLSPYVMMIEALASAINRSDITDPLHTKMTHFVQERIGRMGRRLTDTLTTALDAEGPVPLEVRPFHSLLVAKIKTVEARHRAGFRLRASILHTALIAIDKLHRSQAACHPYEMPTLPPPIVRYVVSTSEDVLKTKSLATGSE